MRNLLKKMKRGIVELTRLKHKRRKKAENVQSNDYGYLNDNLMEHDSPEISDSDSDSNPQNAKKSINDENIDTFFGESDENIQSESGDGQSDNETQSNDENIGSPDPPESPMDSDLSEEPESPGLPPDDELDYNPEANFVRPQEPINQLKLYYQNEDLECFVKRFHRKNAVNWFQGKI